MVSSCCRTCVCDSESLLLVRPQLLRLLHCPWDAQFWCEVMLCGRCAGWSLSLKASGVCCAERLQRCLAGAAPPAAVPPQVVGSEAGAGGPHVNPGHPGLMMAPAVTSGGGSGDGAALVDQLSRMGEC